MHLRTNQFDHTRYQTEKALLSGLLSWWRQAAKWRLGNELKKLRRRKENIAFESELTEDYNDDGRKLDGVMQNWHETIGGVTAQEAAIYYRELKARIERLLPKMNKKYAAAIRHHFLNEHNPMKPTKEEKQQFMSEHCIKTDENYNKIKLLAKQQLRKLLDTDTNEE